MSSQCINKIFDAEVAVVVVFNDKWSPYGDIAIRSILANAAADRNYDIIVLSDGIKEQNRRWISRAAKGHENFSIRFFNVAGAFDFDKLFVDRYYNKSTYYRLTIPDIMQAYSRVIYLDVDLVADTDIAALYDIDTGDKAVAAVRDICSIGQSNLPGSDCLAYQKDVIGLDDPMEYFNAGVLVFNIDRLRAITSTKQLMETALSRDWRRHDQDVLNVVCRGSVYYLPQKWNVIMNPWEPGDDRIAVLKNAPAELFREYMAAREAPKIVHFASYQKPWQVVDCDMAEYFWDYAKLSPYYPRLARTWTRCFAEEDWIGDRQRIAIRKNKLLNFLLPWGSVRRAVVKKMAEPFIRLLEKRK